MSKKSNSVSVAFLRLLDSGPLVKIPDVNCSSHPQHHHVRASNVSFPSGSYLLLVLMNIHLFIKSIARLNQYVGQSPGEQY